MDERDDRHSVARQTTSEIQAFIRTVLQQPPQFQTLLAQSNCGRSGVVPKVGATRQTSVLQVDKFLHIGQRCTSQTNEIMPDEPRPDKVSHDQYGNNTGQNLQYSAQSNMPRVGRIEDPVGAYRHERVSAQKK